jgi:hypothetical protein
MRSVMFALLPIIGATSSQAGIHPPEVEQRLSFLVNDWTIEGYEATYRENCDWFAGRSFVVCNTEDRSSGDLEHSVSIFGWSASTQNYTYYHYAQNGRSRSETCFPSDIGGLTCLGQRRDGPNVIESRSHIWPVEGGADFRSERSINGGPWQETVRLKYVTRLH